MPKGQDHPYSSEPQSRIRQIISGRESPRPRGFCPEGFIAVLGDGPRCGFGALGVGGILPELQAAIGQAAQAIEPAVDRIHSAPLTAIYIHHFPERRGTVAVETDARG